MSTLSVLSLLLSGAVAGMAWERFFTMRYIQMKADAEGRTAMCVGNKFYYVLPEEEYVQHCIERHSK